jgi:hypothetical protein
VLLESLQTVEQPVAPTDLVDALPVEFTLATIPTMAVGLQGPSLAEDCAEIPGLMAWASVNGGPKVTAPGDDAPWRETMPVAKTSATTTTTATTPDNITYRSFLRLGPSVATTESTVVGALVALNGIGEVVASSKGTVGADKVGADALSPIAVGADMIGADAVNPNAVGTESIRGGSGRDFSSETPHFGQTTD